MQGLSVFLRETDLFCRNKDFNNENSYKNNYSYRL